MMKYEVFQFLKISLLCLGRPEVYCLARALTCTECETKNWHSGSGSVFLHISLNGKTYSTIQTETSTLLSHYIVTMPRCKRFWKITINNEKLCHWGRIYCTSAFDVSEICVIYCTLMFLFREISTKNCNYKHSVCRKYILFFKRYLTIWWILIIFIHLYFKIKNITILVNL